MRRFKYKETFMHRYAVRELSLWVNGIVEYPFCDYDVKYLFVPDVTVFKDKKPEIVYEVVYKNPLNGKKLGMMQYWCYLNNTGLVVYLVDAEYILRHIRRPRKIKHTEKYVI